MKISAIVTCYNEAPNIERALRSLKWCDETIVVDSFSTDGTTEIAKEFTTRFFQREYINPADQKNWAIQKAENDWVLILDADEEVTDELRNEIIQLSEKSTLPCDAYWIKRFNYFMGRRIKFSGWQRDKVIRFFNRKLCKYPDQFVHEEIVTSGRIGILQNRLNHFTYRDMEHFMAKMDRYAKWSAIDKNETTGKITKFHLILKPAFRFFKHYIIELGILDGYRGFTIARINAYGVRRRYIEMKKIRAL